MDKNTNYLPMIGVDKLAYALVTEDNTGGYEADTPKLVPGLTEVGFNINAQNALFHADNGPYAAATALGDIDVAIACADVPPSMRPDLYGHAYNAETGELDEGDLNAPYIAVMYRIQKSNGKYRYVKIYKAKAVPKEETVQTKGGSVNFQTNGFSLKAVKRNFDGVYRRILDEDDPALEAKGITSEMLAEKWFSDVSWSVADEAAE